MPITAIAVLAVSDMACSLVFGAPCQIRLLAGQEHGRTIPLAEVLPRDPTVLGFTISRDIAR
jgi:hypothetical protein